MKKTYTFSVENGASCWACTAIDVTYEKLLEIIAQMKVEHPEYHICDIREGW